MADTNITDAAQQAAANAVVDLVDAGSSNAAGKLRIYDDGTSQPSDADDSVPAGSTLLVEFDLQNPAYGNAASSGQATLQGTTISATAVATGTAAWYRVVDRDETAVFDGDVSGTGGSGDLQLDNTSLASGQTVNLNSHTYTQPSG